MVVFLKFQQLNSSFAIEKVHWSSHIAMPEGLSTENGFLTDTPYIYHHQGLDGVYSSVVLTILYSIVSTEDDTQ